MFVNRLRLGFTHALLYLVLRLSWARCSSGQPGRRPRGAVRPGPAAAAGRPYSRVDHRLRPPGRESELDPVTVERDGHVLLIGVNPQAQRNAFDLAVIEALGAAYETLGTDQELHAGVLFGHGDHFSAGLDLAEVGPVVAQDGPGALGSSRRFDPFGVWRDPVPKPVVLAVNGIAYTLSIELALAADIVVAA